MEIIEFEEIYSENVKDLLVELQEFIVSIDKFKLNIITDEYREIYFQKTIDELKTKNGKMYLARENNLILGLISGYIEQYDEYDKIDYLCPKKGIVSELIVSKNSRGSGLGQQLIEKIEQYFIECNCSFCQIDVFAYNIVAKKFYEKNNYESRLITMSKKLK